MATSPPQHTASRKRARATADAEGLPFLADLMYGMSGSGKSIDDEIKATDDDVKAKVRQREALVHKKKTLQESKRMQFLTVVSKKIKPTFVAPPPGAGTYVIAVRNECDARNNPCFAVNGVDLHMRVAGRMVSDETGNLTVKEAPTLAAFDRAYSAACGDDWTTIQVGLALHPAVWDNRTGLVTLLYSMLAKHEVQEVINAAVCAAWGRVYRCAITGHTLHRVSFAPVGEPKLHNKFTRLYVNPCGVTVTLLLSKKDMTTALAGTMPEVENLEASVLTSMGVPLFYAATPRMHENLAPLYK